MQSDRRHLVWILAVVALASALPRGIRGLRHSWSTATDPPPGVSPHSFFTYDADGLYHARRVDRALSEGLSIAERDPYLNWPDGSAIPWPPYYDLLLAAIAAPFAPADPLARRRFVEPFVASVPFACGIATSCVAALAGFALAGPAGALFAGLHHAWTRGSWNYSALGAADHHAFLALGSVLLWLGLSRAFARGRLERARAGAATGAVLGALAGVLMGSWVAALVYVVLADVSLGWLLFVRARAPLRGLPAFGLAFHLAALCVLAPAILASPWKDATPWIAVNLSWFHAAYLLLGALVFAPPALMPARLAAGRPAARRYPWIVAATLALLFGLSWLVDAGPARGVREGFAWASRANEFMDVVLESAPLIGHRAGGFRALPDALGWLALAAPLVLFAAVRAALPAARRATPAALALVPWIAAIPVLFAQALAQRRFSNALAAPLAVLLAWAFARLAPRRAWAWAPLAVIVAAASHAALFTGSTLRNGYASAERTWGPELLDRRLGDRMTLEWLGQHAASSRPAAVMAHWDDGHAIEWVANLPTVATNFGSYVGASSWTDPPAFFLARGEAAALAVLDRRDARWVLVTREIWKNFSTLVRVAHPNERESWIDPSGRLQPRALGTTAAALVPITDTSRSRPGAEVAGTAQLGGLRLVYVSPQRSPREADPRTGAPMRCGYVWERVPGAVLQARAAPGTELSVALDVRYERAGFTLEVRAAATAGRDGQARLRLPYATDAPNGDGRATGPLRWSAGAATGEAEVPAAAVLAGDSLSL